MTQLIAYASLLAAPWKNGGGSTTQIAIAPSSATLDDFDWRISLATIAASGPFSMFPGIDRTIALVEGEGVILDLDGEQRFILGEDSPSIEFPGEAQAIATVIDGPTTDFNVMTRRERCTHQLGRRKLEGISGFAPRGDATILFLVDGDSLSVSSDAERIGLVRFDAVVFGPGDPWTLEAETATILIVDIFFN